MTPSQARRLGIELFTDAAEVWFWYRSVRKARDAGWTTPRTIVVGSPRPCEIGDIERVLIHVTLRKELTDAHLAVLRRYGDDGREPVPDHAVEGADAVLWREAMTVLEPYWRGKGILLP